MSGIKSKDISEMMERAGRMLGVTEAPFVVEPLTLTEAYRHLSQGGQNYELRTSPENREEHKRRLVMALSLVEYQACWHVLQDFYSFDEIIGMDPQGRKSCFLDQLYRNTMMYPFFKAREDAIRRLSTVKIIAYEEFSPSLESIVQT